MSRTLVATLLLPMSLVAAACGNDGPPPGPPGPYPGGYCTQWDADNHITYCYGTGVLHCVKDGGVYVWKYDKTCDQGCLDGKCL